MNKLVFLGGTCGKNNWRDSFIRRLSSRRVPCDTIFNPVLRQGEVWNEEHRHREDEAKKNATVSFFFLGDPGETELLPYGMYSAVQLVANCYNVRLTTRAFVDLEVIKDPSMRKAFTKIVRDLSNKFPKVFCSSWNQLVTETANLWAINRDLLAFLAGTAGINSWRDRFLVDLRARGVNTARFLDPVVPQGTWNVGVQKLEDQMMEAADHMFTYLGDPGEPERKNQFSTYSVVEAYMGLFEDSTKTVICFDHTDIRGHSLDSLKKSELDMRKRFPMANIFNSLAEAEDWLVANFTSVSSTS